MSPYSQRIETLYERSQQDQAAFEPPAEPPAQDRAMEYLRNGVGEAVAVYVDARTGNWHRFEEAEFTQLETAMNTWLELYARCYGHDIDAAFTVREAAEALIDTHNIHDVARILTHIPTQDDPVASP